MTPILLSKKIPWFGEHTGYQQLPRYLQKIEPQTRVIAPRHKIGDRFVGKAYSLYRGWAGRNQWDAAAEFRFERTDRVPEPLRHILHLEEHLWYLDRWEKAPRDLVGTVHLPPGVWTPSEIALLGRLSSGIVLYRRDYEYYESLLGKGRVHFIRHGVDVDFFRPDGSSPEPTNLLFSGHYLRNTPMLHRVITRLAERHRDLRFHLLVPPEFRHLPGLPALADRPEVSWHHGLNDDALRLLIARSYLLLLPMESSGANTAVVEALACGTPIVTTDVGGIRDYGGDDIFPIVANNDDDAMVSLVEQYLSNPGWRNEVGRQCRDFALTHLSWPAIAREHMDAYATLAA